MEDIQQLFREAMADLKKFYAAVDEPSAEEEILEAFSAMGQEIYQDFTVLAVELAKPEYLFQILGRASTADLYH